MCSKIHTPSANYLVETWDIQLISQDSYYLYMLYVYEWKFMFWKMPTKVQTLETCKLMLWNMYMKLNGRQYKTWMTESHDSIVFSKNFHNYNIRLNFEFMMDGNWMSIWIQMPKLMVLKWAGFLKLKCAREQMPNN